MEEESQLDNRRIAKNTLLLYLRMIITTIVSLYTARLLLILLGVEDFGIYNVVGGVVTFMSFINASMTSATQRFLAFDLGKGDIKQYQRTFSMTINVFMILCLIMLIILEILGPWFVANKLVIPDERLTAAQWIFQFSILSFIFSTMTIPFQSAIVSYEKMGIYAYFTFIDVGSKLLICLFLYILPIDRLITYGFIQMCIVLVILIINYTYCRSKLNGCVYKHYWDKSLFSKLSSYAGWNLLGSISWMLCTQGQSIILNIFFGPIVNAAKAIADRINGIIASFVQNFFMAVSPQIIKTYASGKTGETKNLVLTSSRLSFFLMLCLSIPLIFNMQPLLVLWLGGEQVNTDMVIFSQLVLIFTLVTTLDEPITQAVRATGNIKWYQIRVGAITLCFIPVCYIFLKMGFPAYTSMILLIITYLIAQMVRIFYVRPIINVKLREYISEVSFPCMLVTALCVLLLWVYYHFKAERDNLFFVFIDMAVSIICAITIIYHIGLKNKERLYVVNKIQGAIQWNKKKNKKQ